MSNKTGPLGDTRSQEEPAPSPVGSDQKADYRYESLSSDSKLLIDLLKAEEVQNLFESFYQLIRIPMAIIDLKANVLLSSRWQRICTQYHRVNAETCVKCIESDTNLALQLNNGETYSNYYCKNGLMDCASPIYIEDRHVANFFIGQFFPGPPDESFFRQQAARYGFDVSDYMAALSEVPVVEKEKLTLVLDVLVRMTGLITSLGLDRKRLVESENELKRYRDHLEELVATRTAELEKAREAAVAANRAKSLFLANMSHELRTPMNAILGFSQIMARADSLPDKQRQSLGIILKSGEHLLSLINDVLDLSKIESGKIRAEISSFDLCELLDNLVTMLRIRAESKGLDLFVHHSSSFPRYIRSDPAKLRQIIINLVGNAIKFTHAGTVSIRLFTLALARDQKRRLIFEISDTGVGIPPQDMDRIFRPFEQAGNDDVLSEGTGLGLTITREYVKLLGGAIGVESVPGQGSTFLFNITYEPAEAGEIVYSLASGRTVTGAENTVGRRILIVEDQIENRLLLRALLEPFGFLLREVDNGEEALAAALEWRPHLILMDRRMPVMDGLTATIELKKRPECRDIPIVCVTAHAFRDEQEEMLAAGCNGFLRKPFHEQDLFALLEEYLGVRFSYREPDVHVTLPSREDTGPLSRESLARLPEALRKELEVALISLESTEIAKVIADIAALDPALGDKLMREHQKLAYTNLLTVLREAPKETTQ